MNRIVVTAGRIAAKIGKRAALGLGVAVTTGVVMIVLDRVLAPEPLTPGSRP